MVWFIAIAAIILIVWLVYWQLIVAEGTYLGPRIVVLLYDWTSGLYERIKQFDHSQEQWFLGLPLAQALEMVFNPFVLDVGTGTARLPRALLFQPGFRGRVIGLDLSRRMLERGLVLAGQYAERLTLIWQDARVLPFHDSTFDAVSCLEVLEFTPDPRAVLLELVRVLRPGGVLLITNRVGRDARLMPGRTYSRLEFRDLLMSLQLEEVRVQSWQLDYDLAWALKAGSPRGGGVRPLTEILNCPQCGDSPLPMQEGAYVCPGCDQAYPVADDGVIEMVRRRARWRSLVRSLRSRAERE
jgi:SAM-dependent methyltransferase